MSNWGTTPTLPSLLEESGRTLSYAEAISEAMREALAADQAVRLFGEGVTDPAGTYGTTKGLQDEFGAQRVFDVPLAEQLITGMGVGMSLVGLRPIVVHPRNDFMLIALDQLCNHAAKWCFMFGQRAPLPMVVRSVACRGWGSAGQHSQALHAMVAQFPGINVLVPFTPADAKGFHLWGILEAEDPVLIVEHKWLWKLKGEVPAGRFLASPGQPQVLRPGTDVTLVGVSYGTADCLLAARDLAAEGIAAEVIDLRALRPLDPEPIRQSLRKTGRLLVVDPGHAWFGTGAEIITRVAESLDPRVWRAPPSRLGLPDTPIPASSEATYYFSPNHIVRKIKKMLGREGSG